ncbi:MAG: hypothetical protein KDE19_17720 [Caldilineaceae bacterium]|nr:hypothetical protein [Caldilineaceae bacterium]
MKLTVSPESFAEKFTGEIREQTFVQLLLKPLLFIINLLFYVIVVYILIPFSLDLPGNLAVQFVLFLVCLIVATYTTIFLYESACAVTGWLIGYRFALMQVGPIALVHTINGLRLRMIGNDPLVMAGMTWSSPLDRQKLHLRQMIFVNGGNLLLGILVITLQIFLNVVALETLSPLSKLTINLLVITIAYGLQHQILPLVHQLLRLFEHNSQEIVLHANHLTTCALNGTRPRDLDSAEIDHFLAIAQGTPAECQAAYIAYEHFYDQGNLEAAASTLDQAILTLHRTSEPELRTSLILAAAVYEAKHGAGPEQARRWLDLCALPHKSPVAVDLRLQYCTAAALISFRENR